MLNLTREQQQLAHWLAELLRDRDPLYRVDFQRMINRDSKMHPSDYMRHYTNAAMIIVKCAQELAKLPMHPDATPRTDMHWLNVLLGTTVDYQMFGKLDALPSAQEGLPSAPEVLDAQPLLD